VTANTTASRKAKGRKAQNEVREMLLKWAEHVLEPADVKTATMGESGSDIYLSPKARELFPFWGVEVKNNEKLNIWSTCRQAEAHAEKLGGKPIVFFRRNNEPMRVVLLASDFFEVL